MAKSLRCKREKRLRAIKREIVEPYYEKKEAAKLAAQEAALAAPKLPVRNAGGNNKMDIASTAAASISDTGMDIEMEEGNQNPASLRPAGGVGKKMKKKLKIAKRKRHGKGKLRNKRV